MQIIHLLKMTGIFQKYKENCLTKDISKWHKGKKDSATSSKLFQTIQIASHLKWTVCQRLTHSVQHIF